MKTLAKWLVALVLLGAAGFGAWWYFLAAPQAATVPNTVVVARGDIERTVLASGVLEANSLVSVGAEVSGRIEAVHVTLGQDVRKGDLIVEIDSLDQENAVKSAQAVLAGIEAQKRSQEATLVKGEPHMPGRHFRLRFEYWQVREVSIKKLAHVGLGGSTLFKRPLNEFSNGRGLRLFTFQALVVLNCSAARR